MMPVVFTLRSREDLRDIALKIAERNPARAITYVDELEARANRIGQAAREFFARVGCAGRQRQEGQQRTILLARQVNDLIGRPPQLKASK